MSPVIRSPTSASPVGRNDSPHGTSSPVATTSASPSEWSDGRSHQTSSAVTSARPARAWRPRARGSITRSPQSPTRRGRGTPGCAAVSRRRGLGVVRRQAAVGEQVRVAGVDEELGQLRPERLDELASRGDVALLGEELVLLHPVDLHGYAVGPRAERPLAGDRDARLVEQRALRAPDGSAPAAGRAGRPRRSRRRPGPVGAGPPRRRRPARRRRPPSGTRSPPRSRRRCARRTGPATCTVCPPARRSSANASTPSVSPWMWWNSSTSAISPYTPVIERLSSNDP